MKFNEIQVGEQYECGTESYGYQVVVIEKGTFSRQVYHGSRDFRGTRTEGKGVKVARVFKGVVSDSSEWVLPAKILRTWTEATRIMVAREDRATKVADVATRLDSLFKSRGLKYSSCYGSREGLKISVSTGDYARLVEILEATDAV